MIYLLSDRPSVVWRSSLLSLGPAMSHLGVSNDGGGEISRIDDGCGDGANCDCGYGRDGDCRYSDVGGGGGGDCGDGGEAGGDSGVVRTLTCYSSDDED